MGVYPDAVPGLQAGAGAAAWWSVDVGSAAGPVIRDAGGLEQCVADAWTAAAREAGRPRFRPASVSGEAHLALTVETDDPVEPVPPKQRAGRYGGVFGSVVHAAIDVMLRNRGIAVRDVVHRVAGRRKWKVLGRKDPRPLWPRPWKDGPSGTSQG